MGMRSRHPKALGFRCYPASHRSLTLVLWSLVALVVVVNFHLLIIHKEEDENMSTHEIRRSIMRELEVVEKFRLAPPGAGGIPGLCAARETRSRLQ